MTPVFLDACVLYPPLVRGVVLGAAAEGLFRPLWSARVLDEWAIASARNAAEPPEAVEAARAAMRGRFPAAEVPGDAAGEAVPALPDPADAHVLAAAAGAGAEVLLTFNLRDFPARRLAALGLAPRHPDGFLWELLSADPGGAMRRAVRAALDGRTTAGDRAALKRARLPRLGKAFAAGAAP